MKKMTRMLCLLLALLFLLSACNHDSAPTATPTVPTTTQPAGPVVPVIADFNRPLPTLPESKVTATPGANDLILARDGAANATIVYAAGASKAHSAAKDLANYLQKIVGSAFAFIADDQTLPEGNLILVGYTKKTAELGFAPLTGYPDSEKFYIGVKDHCLVLYGNDEGPYQCTQYAVTRFLEEAGCAWLSTEEIWNVIPSCSTLAVKPWGQTFAPRFRSRTMGGLSSTLGNRWMLGGDSHQIGHALLWLIGKGYYNDHPEWYAMIKGERSSPMGWWQPCYSNEALAEMVAGKVKDIFRKNAYQNNYSIAANDGWEEGWCECDDCAALGNHTDQMLTFANRVAQIVSQEYPDRTVSILAYHETFLPPLQTKAHQNVEVMFCTETNPLADFSLDYPIHLGKNGVTHVTYTQSWKASCQQYIDETNLQTAAIWSWFCISGERPAWSAAPWVQGNTVNRIFDQFESMGVERVFADCGGEKTMFRWALFYVYARSMWDDVVDGETLLYATCKKLYGEAADEMFLYYRTLADCAAVCISDDGITWVPPAPFQVYGDYIFEIDATVAAVNEKLSQLTDVQKERAEHQIRMWAYAKQSL